jgi:hypothetical protein
MVLNPFHPVSPVPILPNGHQKCPSSQNSTPHILHCAVGDGLKIFHIPGFLTKKGGDMQAKYSFK